MTCGCSGVEAISPNGLWHKPWIAGAFKFPEDESAKAMETPMGIGVTFTTVAMLSDGWALPNKIFNVALLLQKKMQALWKAPDRLWAGRNTIKDSNNIKLS